MFTTLSTKRNIRKKKAIALIWISLLMLISVSDLVLGDSENTITWEFGYTNSGVDTSINLMDPGRSSEWDKWIQTNHTYTDSGIIHGSDVPESTWKLKPVQSDQRDNWVTLQQNFTFPAGFLMSGCARFWLRIPLRVSVNGTPGSGNRDLHYSNLNLWVNNTQTNQSYLTNWYQLTDTDPIRSYKRHDWMNGRPVLELAIPLYTDIQYEFTLKGKLESWGQTIIYTSYSDLGRDNIMSSVWNYTYYDTGIGEEVQLVYDTIPLDLGYYFLFLEGLPSTGQLGVLAEIPEDGHIFSFDQALWNTTLGGPLTHYIHIPIGPENETEINMKIVVTSFNPTTGYSTIVALDETWATSSIIVRFQYKVLQDDTCFEVDLYPLNNHSQKVIVGVKDYRGGNPETIQSITDNASFVTGFWTDSSQVYHYPIDYQNWRGTNITTVPRATRGSSVFESIPFHVEGEHYDPGELRKQFASAVSPFKLLGQYAGFKTENRDAVQEYNQEIIDIGIQALTENQSPEVIQLPTDNNIDVGLLQMQTLKVNEVLHGSMVGSMVDDLENAVVEGKDKWDEWDPQGDLIDAFGAIEDHLSGALDSLTSFGAELVATLTELVQGIISIFEYILTIGILLGGFVYFLIVLAIPIIPFEIMYFIASGEYDKIKTVFMIFRGGG